MGDIANRPVTIAAKSTGYHTGLGSVENRGGAAVEQIEMVSPAAGSSKAKTNQVVPVAHVASSGETPSQLQSKPASDPRATGGKTQEDQIGTNQAREGAAGLRNSNKHNAKAEKILSAADYAQQKSLRVQKENLRNFKFVNQKLNEMQMTMNIGKDFEAETADRTSEAEEDAGPNSYNKPADDE